MVTVIRTQLFVVALIGFALIAHAQDVSVRRVLNVTFNSPAARQLSNSRGRVVWRETDIASSNENLRYFSGAELFLLDSNLTGGTSAIDGDAVVWNSASGIVKMFNTRTWDTTWLGPCYNPDGVQPVSVANGIAAFARAKNGGGTTIILHSLAGGGDTALDAGIWNLEPSAHQGQVAWTVSASTSPASPSDIYFFDGVNARKIPTSAGTRNTSPVLKDGQVVWICDSSGTTRVKLFSRDSTVTLASPLFASEVVAGHDASDGVAIAAFCDTSLGISRITMYDEQSREFSTFVDSAIITSVHIDNGVMAWQSGTGPGKTIKYFALANPVSVALGAGENPVVDDDVIAWTLGDAVELNVPITYSQLTADLKNGWEQSRFKPIDNGKIAFGNFDQSLHTRLFFDDAVTQTRVADSTLPNDFVMMNDGVMIWRENADTLWMYDGSGPRVKLLDSLQVENMYVSNGYISFNGFRLNGGNSILQAWLYNIAGRTLRQLTFEDTVTTRTNVVLCDGPTAAWYRDSSGHYMIMYYDGSSTRRLSNNDSTSFAFGYRRGVIVWSEVVNGTEQVFSYDTATHAATQITHANTPSTKVATDGEHIVWYSDLFTNPTLYYYDIATGTTTKVAHAAYQNFRWDWLSDGKIAWCANGDVFVYDGKSISQLTSSGQFPPNKEAYIDKDYVVWNRTDPSSFVTMGNIFRGTLHAHPSFAAKNIYGRVPLTVSFVNTSWQGGHEPLWDFGDGGLSSLPNPDHTYSLPGRYSVTLTVSDPSGARSEKKTLLVNAVVTTGVETLYAGVPASYALFQNYPNPFNPSTSIRFSVRDAGFVSVKVYDMLGREVATVVGEQLQPGTYTRLWDAKNFPSGVYTYQLTAGGFSEARKMAIIK